MTGGCSDDWWPQCFCIICLLHLFDCGNSKRNRRDNAAILKVWLDRLSIPNTIVQTVFDALY